MAQNQQHNAMSFPHWHVSHKNGHNTWYIPTWKKPNGLCAVYPKIQDNYKMNAWSRWKLWTFLRRWGDADGRSEHMSGVYWVTHLLLLHFYLQLARVLDRLWPTHFTPTSLEGRVSQEILACNYHWTSSGGNWREHHCVDSKNMSNNTLLFWIRYCRVWCLGIASTMISMSWISRVGFLVCLVVRLVSHSGAHLFLNFLTYVLRPQMACHGVSFWMLPGPAQLGSISWVNSGP